VPERDGIPDKTITIPHPNTAAIITNSAKGLDAPTDLDRKGRSMQKKVK
jgi:hypothetical protein